MAYSRMLTSRMVSRLMARLTADVNANCFSRCHHLLKNSPLPCTHNLYMSSTLAANSNPEQSANLNDTTVEEEQKDNLKTRSKKQRAIIHRRQLLKTQGKDDDVEWQEFSKNLSEEDSFGTLSSEEVEHVVTRPGISAKRHHSGRKRTAGKRSSQGAVDENWASEFGTMADVDNPDYKEIEMEQARFEDDEGEEDSPDRPHRRLAATGRKHTQNWYGKEIERLSAQGKIYECIEVLETTMLKEDRVMPNQYVFTVLIGALGRVGYTKKAFSLYNKMKKFGLAPEDPTYTALFNACSNSPWKEDGLKRATKLLEQLYDNNIQPNLTTYKAMIKAFGRCGDLQLAFSLVDDLNKLGYRADEEIFAMVLQACLSDKDTGLRYAIEVWRRLKKRKKVSPTIYHYNLLLRIIRDCQIGDPLLANQLIQGKPDTESQASLTHPQQQSHHDQEPANRLQGSTTNTVLIDEISVSARESATNLENAQQDTLPSDPKPSWWNYKSDSMTSIMQCIQDASNTPQAISILDADVPNILERRQSFGDVISLGNLDTKENRLALFGGLPGILSNMRTDGVKPDIKSFTQLLDLIPSDRDSERDLLAVMNSYGVDKDVGLLNMLIKRRNARRDYKGAKDVLNLLALNNLTPDVITYGCLAMGCKEESAGLELLTSMEKAGMMPTVYICDILVLQARLNFSYLLALCQHMRRMNIEPNESILKKCENRIEKARQLIVLKEKGRKVPAYVMNENFAKDFERFMKFYKPWLQSINVDVEPHPWEQFRKRTPGQQSDSSQPET